ncbi:hypothetical protein chiPu_0028981, partial [Chiloscyllium punctatum]|nr:hypothetical protein [Chiloscyllium punctatum]
GAKVSTLRRSPLFLRSCVDCLNKWDSFHRLRRSVLYDLLPHPSPHRGLPQPQDQGEILRSDCVT